MNKVECQLDPFQPLPDLSVSSLSALTVPLHHVEHLASDFGNRIHRTHCTLKHAGNFLPSNLLQASLIHPQEIFTFKDHGATGDNARHGNCFGNRPNRR